MDKPQKLTNTQILLKMATDIANCKHERVRKKWMKMCIEHYLEEPEAHGLSEEDIEMLKQELLKYS